MSDPTDTVDTMMIDCPEHQGSFDCTPFCPICEGEQEYEETK